MKFLGATEIVDKGKFISLYYKKWRENMNFQLRKIKKEKWNEPKESSENKGIKTRTKMMKIKNCLKKSMKLGNKRGNINCSIKY
jgi:hypothetical protein